MKFDRISVIFRLHGLSAVFRNFLKIVKTLEPKTYITILSIPSVISGRNIKGSIFPTLCHIFSISLGPYRESLLNVFSTCTNAMKMIFIILRKMRGNSWKQPRHKSSYRYRLLFRYYFRLYGFSAIQSGYKLEIFIPSSELLL